MTTHAHRSLAILLLCLCPVGLAYAAEPANPGLKSESFDRDPGWDAVNNRVTPKNSGPVVQDFGYSPTSFAGDAKGEVGGRLTRAAKSAHYAAAIAPKTLNDKLTAWGTFALTKSGSGSAVFFGWFNAKQPEASGRLMNSLGIELGGERSGGRLAVRSLNRENQTTGSFVTKFGRYRTPEEKVLNRPTPI